MKLWRCPDCGNQNRAPGKPRRNDVRRFCLPCSQRTGYMVERVCPTLEKKRAKVKAKVSAKGKAVRAKATAVRKIKDATIEKTFYIDGVDVRPILKRMQAILKRYPQEVGEPGHVVCDPFTYDLTTYDCRGFADLGSAVWTISWELLSTWTGWDSCAGMDCLLTRQEFVRICTRFRSRWRHDVVKVRNGWPNSYE